MSVELKLTTAGITAAVSAVQGGAKVDITTFKVGDGAYYIPTGNETDLVSSTRTDIPSTYTVLTYDTVSIDLIIPVGVVLPDITEVGLYLADGTLFALGTLSNPIVKIDTMEILIPAVFQFGAAALVINVTSTLSPNFPEVLGYDNLPVPNGLISTIYKVLSGNHYEITVKHKNSNGWASQGFALVHTGVASVIAAQSLTVPSLKKYAGMSIDGYVYISAGVGKGYTRTISSVSSSGALGISGWSIQPNTNSVIEVWLELSGVLHNFPFVQGHTSDSSGINADRVDGAHVSLTSLAGYIPLWDSLYTKAEVDALTSTSLLWQPMAADVVARDTLVPTVNWAVYVQSTNTVYRCKSLAPVVWESILAINLGLATSSADGLLAVSDFITLQDLFNGVMKTGLNAERLGGNLSSYFTPNSVFNSHANNPANPHNVEAWQLNDFLTHLKNVDGAGSGIDSDLLDGQQGSFYAPQSSLSAHQSATNPHNITPQLLGAEPVHLGTYTNRIASRANNVNYTNTTGKVLFVSVRGSPGQDRGIRAYVDGYEIYYNDAATIGGATSVFFAVPPGSTYRVYSFYLFGASALAYWYEF